MKSMTGFGSAEGIFKGHRISIELKTLNHRYLEFKLKTPREYSVFETKIIHMAKKVFHRGSVEIFVFHDFVGHKIASYYCLNRRLAVHYRKELTRVLRQLHLKGEPTFDQILSLPDIWVSQEKNFRNIQWHELKRLLYSSFEKVEKMRVREGEALSRVILNTLTQLKQELLQLTQQKEIWIRELKLKLEKRVRALLSDSRLDPQRFNQEIAYLADRSDVSEECERLASHFNQFKIALKTKGPVGKHLDFIIQEILREVNTIGSKIQHVKLSSHVIKCKSLLEKIREQVQNVE